MPRRRQPDPPTAPSRALDPGRTGRLLASRDATVLSALALDIPPRCWSELGGGLRADAKVVDESALERLLRRRLRERSIPPPVWQGSAPVAADAPQPRRRAARTREGDPRSGRAALAHAGGRDEGRSPARPGSQSPWLHARPLALRGDQARTRQAVGGAPRPPRPPCRVKREPEHIGCGIRTLCARDWKTGAGVSRR